MKWCNKCKRLRPLTDFTRNRKAKDGLGHDCSACRKARVALYYINNKELHRARKILYIDTHPDQVRATRLKWTRSKKSREYMKKYRSEHAKQIRKLGNEWYSKNVKGNPEMLARYREYARRRKDKAKARHEVLMQEDAAYRGRVRSRIRAVMSKRRAHLHGTYTPDEFTAICLRSGNACLACGISGDSSTLTVDHVVPVFYGGSNYPTNLQPLCRSCNGKKSKTIVDYRDWTMDLDDIGLGG